MHLTISFYSWLVILTPTWQCNGLHPCNTCTKRKLECEYRGNGNSRESIEMPDGPVVKRRHLESSPPTQPRPPPQLPHISPLMVHPPIAPSPVQRRATATERFKVTFETDPDPASETECEPGAVDQELELHSRNSTVSGPDEETHLLQSTRMLQDPTGRLCKYCVSSRTDGALTDPQYTLEIRHPWPFCN